MNQSQRSTCRIQFSLAVMLIGTGLAAIATALFVAWTNRTIQVPPDPRIVYVIASAYFFAGAAIGLLVGYGVKKWKGAIICSIVFGFVSIGTWLTSIFCS